jgi:hypothetical protein
MKNIFILAIVAVLGMASCTKTEVFNEELTTDVVFKPVAADNQSLFKSAGTDINPGAFGDDFITVAISGMNLSATHMASGRVVSEQFNVVEDGSGTDVIQLSGVSVGWNMFYATTTSYVETPHTDPRGSESDGFSAWNKVREYPFTQSPEEIATTDSAVKYLRTLPPYVEFVGEASQEVFFEGCDEGACNEVEMDMEALQGRFIATVEFEDVELAHYYTAKCKMTHDGGAGPAPAVVADLDYTKGTNVPFVWFYYSHESATEDVNLNLVIELREKGNNSVLRTWTLNTADYADQLAITSGVDRWLKITLTEEALYSNCTNFRFNWEWEEDNTEIDLGDCDGDGIPNEEDETPGCPN